jgi:DNA mismatch endonuclease (patch repair protein)
MPSSNTTYWNAKRLKNRQRDARRTRELEAMGWRVLRLWEHEVLKESLKSARRVEKLLEKSRRR